MWLAEVIQATGQPLVSLTARLLYGLAGDRYFLE